MNYSGRVPKAELLRKLRPYGCKATSFDAGFDLIVTGWGHAFTLALESDGCYSKWSVDKAFLEIMRTKPHDWQDLDC